MKQTVAAIQLNSNDKIASNMGQIDFWVGKAKAQGAQLALLPENCVYMGKVQGETKNIAEPLGNGEIQRGFSTLAAKYAIWLLVGAFATIENGKVYQTLLVYDDLGQLVTHYHKRHLFDVTLPNSRESYRESDAFTAGQHIQLVDTPVGRLGLSICYDLRFPEQFRKLVEQGATTLILPAAFTYKTGKAHWKVLLRARAIENQCYVIAAAQTGTHPGNRETWGHSMIISPWGEVLSSLPKGEGFVTAEINLALLAHQREVFPTLLHRK